MTRTKSWPVIGATMAVAVLAVTGVVYGMGAGENDHRAHTAATIPVPVLPEIRGEEHATLTSAPNVPAPITRDYATRVIVDLEVVEKTMRGPGTDYEL